MLLGTLRYPNLFSQHTLFNKRIQRESRRLRNNIRNLQLQK